MIQNIKYGQEDQADFNDQVNSIHSDIKVESVLSAVVCGLTASTFKAKKEVLAASGFGIHGTLDRFHDYGKATRDSILHGNRPSLPVIAKYRPGLLNNLKHKRKYSFGDVTSPYKYCFDTNQGEVIDWIEAVNREIIDESMTGIESPHHPLLMKDKLNHVLAGMGGGFTGFSFLQNKIQLNNSSSFSDEEVMTVADIAHRCIRLNPATFVMCGVVILGSASHEFSLKLKDIFPLVQFFVKG